MKNSQYVLLAILLIFTGCADDGAPGPKGDKGEQGVQGEKGEQGAKGEAGTANVIYSDWINASFIKQPAVPTVWVAKIHEPKVTQDIVDKGIVFVYYKSVIGATAHMLDFHVPDSGTFMTTYIGPGIIYVAADIDRSTGFLRYVIVPGGIPLNGRSAQLDYNDYTAVKAYYKIPD